MKLRVGAKLQSIREERKLTQIEIAELLGVSQSAYARMERGETQLTVEQLMRFSELLEVPFQSFLPDTVSFTNTHYDGQGGVVFGNFNYNANADERVLKLEAEAELLRQQLSHAEEKGRLQEERISLLEKQINLMEQIR